MGLTVILTVAVGTRPECICKVPYITFFDRCFQLCLVISIWISFANIYTISICGGYPLSDTPIYMKDIFSRHQDVCDVSWCGSTSLDCRFLVCTVVIWLAAALWIMWRVYRKRSNIWAKVSDETSSQKELLLTEKKSNYGQFRQPREVTPC